MGGLLVLGFVLLVGGLIVVAILLFGPGTGDGSGHGHGFCD